ncbi:MAG: hypothetical protein J6Q68_03040 [Clostridia bacterium]|nr:hypothetical protein [Clostridia bacterium]
MKKSKAFISAMAAVLFCIMLVPLFLFSAKAQNDDYSKPGVSEKVTYTAADILSALTGLELCEAERQYLELYGDYSISYGAHIPTSFVSINYDEETGELAVMAKKYTYTAENGASIVFLPVSVSVGDRKISPSEFSDDGFLADFGSVKISEGEQATVVYTTEFTVSERTVNNLINKAYYDALYWEKTIAAKEAEYQKNLVEYEQGRALYEEYLNSLAEYEINLALYKAYKTEKRLYDDNLSQFNAYLEELSDYEKKLVEYREYEQKLSEYNEAYLLYKKYLDDKKEYETNLALYNTYVENIKIAKEQIAVIDGLKSTSTTLERSVYNAIVGNTVTEVIANKDAIANNTVGVKPQTVDMAGEATEKLRELFAAYYALESESDKYTYYAVNYEAFKESFINLFISLDKMYENSKVKLALNEKGLKEKYEILLGQLYYVANALSDSPVQNYDKTAYYDSSYKINKVTGATPLSVLERKPYMIDTGRAEPLVGGYPVKVEKPELVEVSEPQKPKTVVEPIAPDAALDPGEAPNEVAEPIIPSEVANPGDEPQPYVAPDPVKNIMAAYERGELGNGPRDLIVGDRKISASVEVKKQIVGAEIFKVEFFDESGNLLCTTYADKGTYAEYVGPVQRKDSDERATYQFIGWADETGELRDVTSVTENLTLYPKFAETPKRYTVSWNVDGKLTHEELTYGEIPSFNAVPEKEDFGSFYYVFSGWDKPISSVTGDVTYTALFEAKFLFTTQSGSGVIVDSSDGNFIINCTTSYDTVFDISKILVRAAESGGIKINSAKYSIELSYGEVKAMCELGAKSISVEQKLLLGGRYSFKFGIFDENGNEITANPNVRNAVKNVKLSVTLPITVTDPESLKVYYLENEARKPVRATYGQGKLSLTCLSGVTYYTAEEYSVNVIPAAPISFKTSVSAASRADVVSVIIEHIPGGVSVDAVYYLDESGKRFEISGNQFQMVAGSVNVGIDFHYEKYKVTFVADMKTVLTQTLLYGQLPTPPSPPEKASDGTYSYTFVGWTPEVKEITHDVIYVARYEKTLLPPKEEPTGLQITPGVLRIIVMGAIGAFYVGGVLLPVSVIASVKGLARILRRKRRGKRKKTDVKS